MLTYGSAFSGIGGLDLAVEHVFGAEPLWHVEPDPYAAAVLRRHWPNVPNLNRIELVDGSTPRPDIICGGFPCQDISLAGAGAGLDGERSGLWWQLARVIEQLEPWVVVLENVAALLARGLGAVLGTLARLGFDAEWSAFRAADVGAPHLRRRIFLVAAQSRLSDADREHLRQERQRARGREQEAALARGDGAVGDAAGERRGERVAVPAQSHAAPDGPGDDLADRDVGGSVRQRLAGLRDRQREHGAATLRGHDPHGRDGAAPWPPAPGDSDAWGRWSGPVPGVRRAAYGPCRGLDARRRRERLRCLGNAVVPAQAAAAISELWQRLIGEAAPC